MFFGRQGGGGGKRYKLSGTIVTGGSNNNIEFWNIRSGSREHNITSPRYTQYCFDFLNHQYIVAGTDQTALLINLRKKNVEKQFTGHTSFIWSIRAINQERFVSAGGDTTCRIWSIKKNSEIQSYRHGSGNLRGIRVLKTLPGRVASCGSSGYVKVWSMKKGKEEYSLNPQPHGQIWDLDEDSRTKTLVVGGYTQPYLYFYDTRNLRKKFKVTSRLSNYVTSLCTISELREVWAVCNDGNCYIYDFRKLNNHRMLWKPSPNCIYRVKRLGGRYSNCIAMGGMDYYCRVYDVKKVTKRKQPVLKEWRTNSYVYGLGFCGKSKGSGGMLRLALGMETSPQQVQAQRLKFYQEEDKRFEYVMNHCFKSSQTDMQFMFPGSEKVGGKKIGFWSYFFSHCPSLQASLVDNTKIHVPFDLEVNQDLILKFIMLKKKGVKKLLLSSEDDDIRGLTDEEDEDEEDEERYNFPLFEDEMDDSKSDDDGVSSESGKLDSVFFTLAQKRKFLDYFMFFRHLECYYEMLSVLYEVSKISQLELLLLLFLKCVREYESTTIQRRFLPLDELQKLEMEKKSSQDDPKSEDEEKKKKKKDAPKKNTEEEESDEEDEYDDVFLEMLEKKLYKERTIKMERMEKIQERKMKKEERRREKEAKRRKDQKEGKLFEEEEDDDEDEEEEEEGESDYEEEEEKLFTKTLFGGSQDSYFAGDEFLDEDEDDEGGSLKDGGYADREDEILGMVDKMKETIHFETSFCHFIFFMMKEREEEIRSNSRLLKYFIQVLEQLERCEVSSLEKHKDFTALRFQRRQKYEEFTSSSRFGRFGRRKKKRKGMEEEEEEGGASGRFSATSSTFLNVLGGPLYREGESSNIILETFEDDGEEEEEEGEKKKKKKKKKKKSFHVHKEIMLLRSPFFYRYYTKLMQERKKQEEEEEEEEGEEDEEEEGKKKKKEVFLIEEEVKGDELGLIIQFVYCGQIVRFTKDMRIVLRCLNHAQVYNDQRLVRGLLIYLSKVFSKKKKRMVVSFIVQHGHLLESEELQRKFARVMGNVEMSESETFDEKEMEILLHKSMKKYKVEHVIRKLREENKALKKRNKFLEGEVKKLKQQK